MNQTGSPASIPDKSQPCEHFVRTGSSSSLDTLVQLSYKRTPTDTIKDLKRKAIRLHQTYKLIWPLIDLNSEMEKEYWQSYNCCRELIQEGVYLRAKYCNKRWCFECNAIRSAKMINGYGPALKKFKYPQFVTLTRPNVNADKLENEITYITKTFRLMLKYFHSYSEIKLKGIRKLEVTFNWKAGTYHPHLHLIVDSLKSARTIVDEWLLRNPEATNSAQDVRPADEGSMIELFKYATKIVVDNNMSIYAKDIIFQALRRKRIFQPFNIDKFVSEDVDDIVTQAYGTLDPIAYKKWYFNNDKEDWNSLWDESLLEILKGDLQPEKIFNTS